MCESMKNLLDKHLKNLLDTKNLAKLDIMALVAVVEGAT